MLKRILGMAATAVLVLAGTADARDDRVEKEGMQQQDPFSRDQHSGQLGEGTGPVGDVPETRIWGGDEGSGGPSQNHQPDWKRPAPKPVRTVDIPAGETETTSESMHPEYEPDTGDAGLSGGVIDDQSSDTESSESKSMETTSDALEPESKGTKSVDMNKATPHLALIDAYLSSASVHAKALASLGSDAKKSHKHEVKKNLELSLTKAIEHTNHLEGMDLDNKELLSHLRSAKKSLGSGADVSGHLSAAKDSFDTLAQGAAFTSSDVCGDRQPVRGTDDSKMGEHRHPGPSDIDRDSMPGQDDSIPGAEDKTDLPPPAQPTAPVSDDVSKGNSDSY